jgi:hypothetical protein
MNDYTGICIVILHAFGLLFGKHCKDEIPPVYSVDLKSEMLVTLDEQIQLGRPFDFEVGIETRSDPSFKIIGQVASCYRLGCVQATNAPVEVKSGGKTRLKARLTPIAPGRFNGELRLYTNRSDYRPISITIRATFVEKGERPDNVSNRR